MDDHELIRQIKAKTFLRIQDLMILRYNEVLAEDIFVDRWLRLGLNKADLVAEPSRESLEWMCSAPLTDTAVLLLRAVATAANQKGVFISSNHKVLKVAAKLDLNDVVRSTGFKPEDATFVLKQMSESLVEVVSEQTAVDVEIDRKPIRLQAKKPSVFSKIWKFIS